MGPVALDIGAFALFGQAPPLLLRADSLAVDTTICDIEEPPRCSRIIPRVERV